VIDIKTDSDRVMVYIVATVKALKDAGVEDDSKLVILASAIVYGKISEIDGFDAETSTLSGIKVEKVPCAKYLAVVPKENTKIEIIKCRDLMNNIYKEQ
jgi:hypothetical protein